MIINLTIKLFVKIPDAFNQSKEKTLKLIVYPTTCQRVSLIQYIKSLFQNDGHKCKSYEHTSEKVVTVYGRRCNRCYWGMPETPIIKSSLRVNYRFRGNVVVYHYRILYFTDVIFFTVVLE